MHIANQSYHNSLHISATHRKILLPSFPAPTCNATPVQHDYLASIISLMMFKIKLKTWLCLLTLFGHGRYSKSVWNITSCHLFQLPSKQVYKRHACHNHSPLWLGKRWAQAFRAFHVNHQPPLNLITHPLDIHRRQLPPTVENLQSSWTSFAVSFW